MALEMTLEIELVEVNYEQNKAILTFLDAENGVIREVNFNKDSYDMDKKKFVTDPDKAEKVEGWCEEYFGVKFDDLTTQIGEFKTVYVYNGFNSLFEVDQVDKFTMEQEGEIFQTEIESIEDTGQRISIRYKHDGKLYETKLQYSKYLEDRKEWFVDPIRKEKQFAKFKTHYGVPFAKKDELIGKSIMVEVKVAFNKYPYGEIKKLKAK